MLCPRKSDTSVPMQQRGAERHCVLGTVWSTRRRPLLTSVSLTPAFLGLAGGVTQQVFLTALFPTLLPSPYRTLTVAAPVELFLGSPAPQFEIVRYPSFGWKETPSPACWQNLLGVNQWQKAASFFPLLLCLGVIKFVLLRIPGTQVKSSILGAPG